jgi:hypothetical protein
MVLVEIIVVILVAIVLVAVVAQVRRPAEHLGEIERLLAENRRLHRAVGVAEQALRSVANDTRTDPSVALEVDAALEDVRRAARGDDGPLLGR